MEYPLPDIIEFNGTGVKEGDFKVAMNKLLLYLDELLGNNGQNLNLIPSGIISMWSGATSEIPTGWALCNGENGTPDLRDKFIIGAGGNYEVGATGGAAFASISGNTGETTLTVNQMPSHDHTINSRGDAYSNGAADAHVGQKYSSVFSYVSDLRGGSQSHSHSLSYNVTTLPPYYALCLIMKL